MKGSDMPEVSDPPAGDGTSPPRSVVFQSEYEGDLAEFVPYLEAGEFTGVGRHCTWGNGQIAILK